MSTSAAVWLFQLCFFFLNCLLDVSEDLWHSGVCYIKLWLHSEYLLGRSDLLLFFLMGFVGNKKISLASSFKWPVCNFSYYWSLNQNNNKGLKLRRVMSFIIFGVKTKIADGYLSGALEPELCLVTFADSVIWCFHGVIQKCIWQNHWNNNSQFTVSTTVYSV